MEKKWRKWRKTKEILVEFLRVYLPRIWVSPHQFNAKIIRCEIKEICSIMLSFWRRSNFLLICFFFALEFLTHSGFVVHWGNGKCSFVQFSLYLLLALKTRLSVSKKLTWLLGILRGRFRKCSDVSKLEYTKSSGIAFATECGINRKWG